MQGEECTQGSRRRMEIMNGAELSSDEVLRIPPAGRLGSSRFDPRTM